jgi:hypothetical protein
MDRCRLLLNTFYNTYQILNQELETVLEDLTEPSNAIDRRNKLEDEARTYKPTFPYMTPRFGESSSKNPVQPPYSPVNLHQEKMKDVEVEPEEDPEEEPEEDPEEWGESDSNELIGNSEGWEVDLYAGTKEDPVVCYSSGDETYRPTRVQPYGIAGRSTNPINLDDYPDTEYTGQYDCGKQEDMSAMDTTPYPGNAYGGGQYNMAGDYACSSSHFSMTGLNIGTSDPEYTPSGRPYVPEGIRRTSRNHGWTTGRYYEQEEE